jgi:hypothetical protein
VPGLQAPALQQGVGVPLSGHAQDILCAKKLFQTVYCPERGTPMPCDRSHQKIPLRFAWFVLSYNASEA